MKENECIEEYKILRQELLEIQKTRIWGVLTYLVVVSGISALQSNFYTPFIYIFLIFSSLPFLWYTANRERSRIRIASYIKIVIEPNVTGLGWEAHLSEWREVAPGKNKIQKIIDSWRYILALTGIYFLIVLSCFVLLLLSDTETALKLLGILGILAFIEAYRYLFRVLSSSGEFEKIFIEASRRLAEKEKHGNETNAA